MGFFSYLINDFFSSTSQPKCGACKKCKIEYLDGVYDRDNNQVGIFVCKGWDGGAGPGSNYKYTPIRDLNLRYVPSNIIGTVLNDVEDYFYCDGTQFEDANPDYPNIPYKNPDYNEFSTVSRINSDYKPPENNY